LHAPRSKGGRRPTAVEDAPPDDARTVAQRLSDASVGARVKQALVRVETLRRFNFSPSVVRGHLVLRGDVNTREQYRRAERIAQRQEGVTAVTNQVTVDGQAVSETDGRGEDAEEADATYHTVRRGDTLSEIARKYGVSTRQIRTLNDLSGSLQPGQEIRVR
jgi:FOG: LysM repeat